MALESNLVLDPVCGMRIDPNNAATRKHEGMTYYFCSPGCARQFDADPHRLAHRVEKGHAH